MVCSGEARGESHAHAGTLLDHGGPVVRLTGLRNPCAQINAFRPGLLKVVPGKPITVTLPGAPRTHLAPV